MATAIKAIKPKDITENKGIEKIQIVRGVTINDKGQNLVVDLKLNHKKGTFEIHTKWNMDAITSNATEDSATLMTLSQMMKYAAEKGTKWRDEWKAKREDPDQIKIGLK